MAQWGIRTLAKIVNAVAVIHLGSKNTQTEYFHRADAVGLNFCLIDIARGFFPNEIINANSNIILVMIKWRSGIEERNPLRRSGVIRGNPAQSGSKNPQTEDFLQVDTIDLNFLRFLFPALSIAPRNIRPVYPLHMFSDFLPCLRTSGSTGLSKL